MNKLNFVVRNFYENTCNFTVCKEVLTLFRNLSKLWRNMNYTSQ